VPQRSGWFPPSAEANSHCTGEEKECVSMIFVTAKRSDEPSPEGFGVSKRSSYAEQLKGDGGNFV
jgi:hypothetical protein